MILTTTVVAYTQLLVALWISAAFPGLVLHAIIFCLVGMVFSIEVLAVSETLQLSWAWCLGDVIVSSIMIAGLVHVPLESVKEALKVLDISLICAWYLGTTLGLCCFLRASYDNRYDPASQLDGGDYRELHIPEDEAGIGLEESDEGSVYYSADPDRPV